MLREYKEKPFKNINQGDLNIETEEEKKEIEQVSLDNSDLLSLLKESLKDKVSEVKISSRLKSHPVCLVSKEGMSFEMERILNSMPDSKGVKADKVLEINPNHELFSILKSIYAQSSEKIKTYASLLYNQALLLEGFPIDDPVEFSNQISQLMIDANK